MGSVKIFFAVLITASLVFFTVGCDKEVKAIALKYVGEDKPVYSQNAEIAADDFGFEVTFDDGKQVTVTVLTEGVAATGIIDGKLNTAVVGDHTVEITYKGLTASFEYSVVVLSGAVNYEGTDKIRFVSDTDAEKLNLQWNDEPAQEVTKNSEGSFVLSIAGVKTGYESKDAITNQLTVTRGYASVSVPLVTPWSRNYTVPAQNSSQQYVVRNAQELAGLNHIDYVDGGEYEIVFAENAVIDLMGVEWNPIVAGELNVLIDSDDDKPYINVKGGLKKYLVDGQGATVKGLNITQMQRKYYVEEKTGKPSVYLSGHKDAGLFGLVIIAKDGQTVFRDLTIDGFDIDITGATDTAEDGKNAGALVGQIMSENPWAAVTLAEVTNITVKNGSIKGYSRIGGIVGYVCQAASSITGNVVKNVTVTSVAPNPSVWEGRGEKAGGLVGQHYAVGVVDGNKVEDSTVSAARSAGGLIGHHDFTSSITMYSNNIVAGVGITLTQGAEVAIEGARNAGGLVGSLRSHYNNAVINFGDGDNSNTVSGLVMSATEQDDSSLGRAVGGFDLDYARTFSIKKGTATYDYASLINTYRVGDARTIEPSKYLEFKAAQAAIMDELDGLVE